MGGNIDDDIRDMLGKVLQSAIFMAIVRYVSLAALVAGYVANYHKIDDFITTRFTDHLSVKLSDVVPVGNWGATQFWPVEASKHGKLKLAATPPCVPGTPHCYVTIEAKPSQWLPLAISGTALFAVLLGVVAVTKKRSGPSVFVGGKTLDVTVEFQRDGSATETWTFAGITTGNRKYQAIRYEYEATDTHKPQMTSLSVRNHNHGDEIKLWRTFVPGCSIFRGTLTFAEHMKSPYDFTIYHEAKGAWARDSAEFLRWYPEPMIEGCSNVDNWDYEILHPWEQITVSFYGMEHISCHDPYVVLICPGTDERRLGKENLSRLDDDRRPWRLSLEAKDIDLLTTISVRWHLTDRSTPTPAANTTTSSSESA